MRNQLLPLFICLTVSNIASSSPSVFRTDFEYTYTYEGQIVTLVPSNPEQFSGLKLHCFVKLQVLKDRWVALKLYNVQLFRIGDAGAGSTSGSTPPNSSPTGGGNHRRDPHLARPLSGRHGDDGGRRGRGGRDITDGGKLLKVEKLTRLTGDVVEIMVQHLVTTVTFRYEEGEVRELRASRLDPYWSVNIKRGLLSLLQLKLTQKSSKVEPVMIDTKLKLKVFNDQPSSSSSADSSQFYYSSPSFFSPSSSYASSLPSYPSARSFSWPSSQLNNVFTVTEFDVLGEAVAQYSISPGSVANFVDADQSAGRGEKLVSKVKNFQPDDSSGTRTVEHSLNSNTHDFGLFAGLYHHPSDKPLIQPSVEADYIISGDRHHFLIKRARLRAVYRFEPYGHDAGHVSSHVIQRLVLKSCEPITRRLPTDMLTEMKSMKMEVPRASLVENTGPSMTVGLTALQEKQYKEQVQRSLADVLSNVHPVLTNRSATSLFQLSLVLRNIPRAQLLAIVQSYLSHDNVTAKDLQLRNILLDTLPTIPTPKVASVVIDLVSDGSLKDWRASLSITAMSLVATPTSDIIKSILQLYKDTTALASSAVQYPSHLRRALLLAAGTLTNRMIRLMKKDARPIQDVISTIRIMSNEMERILTESKDEAEKILVLKAIGNGIAAKNLLPVTARLIEDRTQSVVIRRQAVRCLRQLTRVFNNQLQPVLLSVYLDRTEDVHLRLEAFIVLRDSSPSDPLLQRIVQSLEEEPSEQIRSFVYTSLLEMTSLAGASNVPDARKKSAESLSNILVTMPTAPLIGPFDSTAHRWRTYSGDLDIGVSVELDSLKSNQSSFPSLFRSTLHTSMFGQEINLAQFQVEGSGLSAVLNKFVGENGLLSDIFQGNSTIGDILRSLLVKKSSSSHPRGNNSEDPEVEFYSQLLNQELQYWRIKAEDVQSLITSTISMGANFRGELAEGLNVSSLHTVSLVSQGQILATPLGLPLSLNISAAAVVKLDGQVKVDNVPSLADLIGGYVRTGRKGAGLTENPRDKETKMRVDLRPSVNVELFGEMGVDMGLIKTGVGVKATWASDLQIKAQIGYVSSQRKLSFVYDVPSRQSNNTLLRASVVPVISWFMSASPGKLGQPGDPGQPAGPAQPETLVSELVDREMSGADFELTKTTKRLTLKSLGLELIARSHETKSSTVRRHLVFPFNGKQEIEINVNSTDTSLRRYIEVMLLNEEAEKMEGEEEEEEDNNQRQFDDTAAAGNHSAVRLLIRAGRIGSVGSRSDESLKVILTLMRSPDGKQNRLNVTGFDGQSVQTEILQFGCPSRHSWDEAVQALRGVTSAFQNTPTSDIYYLRTSYFNHTNATMSYCLSQWLSVLKYHWFSHLVASQSENNLNANETVVLLEILHNTNKANVFVRHPQESELLFHGVPFHRANPVLSFIRSFSPQNQNRKIVFIKDQALLDNVENVEEANRKFKHVLYGSCSLSNADHLTTFDGSSILLPLNDRTLTTTSGGRPQPNTGSCEVMLTQDCLPGRPTGSLFTVLGSIGPSQRTVVRVRLPGHNIELIKDSLGDHVKLKVNGRNVERGRSSGTMSLRPGAQNQSSLVGLQYKIERVDNAGLKVNLLATGLSITLMDSRHINIKFTSLSPLQGHVCGLCGNYNYDVTDEFHMESTNIYQSQNASRRAFVLSNLVESTNCDRKEYESRLNNRYGPCVKKVTAKLTRMAIKYDGQNGGREKERQLCFSLQPVSVCSRHCRTDRSESKEIAFACFAENSSVAKNYMEKIQRDISLPELADLPVDVTVSVDEALQCSLF